MKKRIFVYAMKLLLVGALAFGIQAALGLALADSPRRGDRAELQPVSLHLAMVHVGAVIGLSDGGAILVGGPACLGRDCFTIGFVHVSATGQMVDQAVGALVTEETETLSVAAGGVGQTVFGVANYPSVPSELYTYTLSAGVTVFLPVMMK